MHRLFIFSVVYLILNLNEWSEFASLLYSMYMITLQAQNHRVDISIFVLISVHALISAHTPFWYPKTQPGYSPSEVNLFLCFLGF